MKTLNGRTQNAEVSAKYLYNTETPKNHTPAEAKKETPKKAEAKKDIHKRISNVVGKIGYVAEVGQVSRYTARGAKRVDYVPVVGRPLRYIPGSLEKINSVGIGTVKGLITGVAIGVSEGVTRVLGAAYTAVKNGAVAGYQTAKNDIITKVKADKEDTKKLKAKVDANKKVRQAKRAEAKAHKNTQKAQAEVKKAA